MKWLLGIAVVLVALMLGYQAATATSIKEARDFVAWTIVACVHGPCLALWLWLKFDPWAVWREHVRDAELRLSERLKYDRQRGKLSPAEYDRRRKQEMGR